MSIGLHHGLARRPHAAALPHISFAAGVVLTGVVSYVFKSGFDTSVNAGCRHSSYGPSMIGEAGSFPLKWRAWLAPEQPVLRIFDEIEPPATLAAMS